MKSYSILKRFEYRQKKNNNLKINSVCKVHHYNWKVYIIKLPREHIGMLRSIKGNHTCKCDEKEKNAMAYAWWAANEV